ncbi:MAG: DinB family protein [Gemmatimonadales bacterium]|nr:DinB family protein [Gemmatimonadales bacterium]
MTFNLTSALPVLRRTPAVLDALLAGLPDEWTFADEGPDTWSAFDVVGHLVHGDRTDWIPRARVILDRGETHQFEPFDRFAQLETSRGSTLIELLGTFRALRIRNLETLESWNLTAEDLARTGTHPEFGRVTLRQLLATWTVHDLGHIAQIVRTMAARYTADVGPWRVYLRILGTA